MICKLINKGKISKGFAYLLNTISTPWFNKILLVIQGSKTLTARNHGGWLRRALRWKRNTVELEHMGWQMWNETNDYCESGVSACMWGVLLSWRECGVTLKGAQKKINTFFRKKTGRQWWAHGGLDFYHMVNKHWGPASLFLLFTASDEINELHLVRAASRTAVWKSPQPMQALLIPQSDLITINEVPIWLPADSQLLTILH